LEDSEQFVQPDHDTSSELVRWSLLRSAEHLCSTPDHAQLVKTLSSNPLARKKLVAALAARAHPRAHVCRDAPHIGPPRLILIRAGRGRALDQQRDRAPQI